MPAKDDVFANIESVADDGYMNIQPASGAEAVITYISVNGGGKCIVSHYDGANEAVIINLSSTGGEAMPFSGQGFPITNADYLRVQNKSGAALIMGYAGYYTKVAS